MPLPPADTMDQPILIDCIDCLHGACLMRLRVSPFVLCCLVFASSSSTVCAEEPNFEQQIDQRIESAVELEAMLLTRHPEEIFAAEDKGDWDEWVEFFSCTREPDRRRKGLVEVEL